MHNSLHALLILQFPPWPIFRSASGGHVGWQKVVCTCFVWCQLSETDTDRGQSWSRTVCVPHTALPCICKSTQYRHRQTDRLIILTSLLFLHLCLFDQQDTADYIRPVSFSLNFKINDTDSGPVLDEGWPTTLKQSVSSVCLQSLLELHKRRPLRLNPLLIALCS